MVEPSLRGPNTALWCLRAENPVTLAGFVTG